MCKKVLASLLAASLVAFTAGEAEAESQNENRSVQEAIEEAREGINQEEPSTEFPAEENIEQHDQQDSGSVQETEANEMNNEQDEMIGLTDQNPFLMFIQMIAALVFVVFLIYMLLRFVNKRTQSFRSTKLLHNIGGVPLGGNRSVQLVKVGDRLLVVGVGESIQLLKELDDPKEVETFVQMQEQQYEQFEQPLTKALGKVNRLWNRESHSPPAVNDNQEAFKALLGKQLKDVSKSQKEIHDAVRERDK
ncbi:flagellar biosynthetic protein FliO [Alkalihalophilus pseudofirmus]|uniref:Flagellar biosynthetic protein FliO n=1 Tax=Alkalihalophilus pseudofirmus TaxID=79885 RepID=A0AAJ2NMU8_ALKPS|nr:flagellar biosynthetic protein FliO [Alkalihalophilus pseudofirmus]MDV2885262.1 flagellar biosynthetic protein FliO [Alkalihalophilus pseudofirmus]